MQVLFIPGIRDVCDVNNWLNHGLNIPRSVPEAILPEAKLYFASIAEGERCSGNQGFDTFSLRGKEVGRYPGASFNLEHHVACAGAIVAQAIFLFHQLGGSWLVCHFVVKKYALW